ncbi:MAG TPA: SurA N-terminal domain-containing protein [Anaerolineales bacterium]|nr:SurA N-terminal domain-containing protein [Anaerolineales bacterium]
MNAKFARSRALFLVFFLIWGIAACRPTGPSPETPVTASAAPASMSTSQQPAASPTPFQPSPTPLPLAALVNGDPITVADYQAELARFGASIGAEPTPEQREQTLQDLINQHLLAQAAAEQGFSADEAMVQARIEALTARLGGQQALMNWMAANGYTETTFRADLQRQIAAAWMRDQIIDAVPIVAEQVHARQILHYNSDQANEALARLQAGASFETLAAEYDPVTEGELGWLPRGVLFDPALEEALFSLADGAASSVIQTLAGSHIVQVIERDPQRPLEAEALRTLQVKALADWLEARRAASDIEIFNP